MLQKRGVLDNGEDMGYQVLFGSVVDGMMNEQLTTDSAVTVRN